MKLRNWIEENVNIWACTDYDGIEEVLQDFINDKKADQPQESSIIKTNRDEENQGTKGYYDCSEDNIIYHYIQQKDPS